MNILVCIKQVPDTTIIKIDPVTNTLMREGVPAIVSPFDAYALEAAARIKDKDKNTKIVVYCGHIGCARSHVAAAYLVKQGYTNVYRYGGGISAWVDAGNAVDKVETPAA